MSGRPFSFRFVFALFVLSFLSLSLLGQRVFSQERLPARAEAAGNRVDEGEKQDELVEELFPYASKAYTTDFSSNSLITATTYAFTALSGVALEEMSSGTTQLVGPSADDTASAVNDIGFDFWFDGVRHTQFSCNANGLCRLGSVVVTTTFTNSLATTTAAPKITPFWDDLCTGGDGKVHYKTTGSPGSRKLVVEFHNMKITRNGTCVGAVGNGTFQLWLSETTGLIQFVYGPIAATTADSGYSVGLQSGVATNFASVTTAAPASVSYITANNAQMTGITGGTSYVFTPTIPTAPTGLNFTNVAAVGLTLNWTDNSSDEVGFAIYRSTDGVNYSFITQTAANATSFADGPLAPSTNYSYRIFAVTEGGVSSVLSGSQMTSALGNISSVAAGGNWSSPATWVGGVVPTSSDQVTIVDNAIVTIDTAAAAYNLFVGSAPALSDGQESLGINAVLQYDAAGAQSLTVGNDVLVRSTGIFRSAESGAVTTHALNVAGDLTNNGILDFSTSSDTAGAVITFTSSNNAVFGGSGGVTDIRAITIAKGTQSSILELNPTNFTVQGVNTDVAGFLTVTSGTFKISGTFTVANRVFTTAAYSIPALGGFWLNNPNFTVAGQNGSPTTTGLLRITNGTFNVGQIAGNSMGGGAGAQFIFEGGTSNFAGRLQTTSSVSYTQSGGAINVCTVGNTATTACFGLTSTLNAFTMSGGTIRLVQINSNATAASRRDYSVGGTPNITGGTLIIGDAATTGNTGNFDYRILGDVPNIMFDNTTNAKSLILAGTAEVWGNLTIPTGSTVFLHNGTTAQTLQFRGSSIQNNGVIDGGVVAASRLNFLGTSPQSYSGTGTFGTGAAPASGFGILTQVTLNAPIVTNRVNLFGGQMINSNQITLGNGGASATVVQTSQAGSLVDGGTFDVSPVFNTGTGGHTILYLVQPSLRTTGFEVPPSRSILAMTADLPNNLMLAGGDLTITGTMTLTNGFVMTGASTITHGGTATRTNGFVKGNLSRNFAAPGAYTYHLGDGAYSPLAANVTAGTGSLTAAAVGTAQPNIPTPAKALSRHWKLTGTGVTSDLTFSYNDPGDIPGTATEANFVIMKYDGTFSQPGGMVDTAANTATITGVTSFSDWTLADPAALVAPGVLQLSNSTYSANENAGSVTVTVNRVNGTDGAVSVDYALGGGTATGGGSCGAGIDYVNTGGTVMFANGESSKMFNVTLCGDTDIEADETFDVTLSNPTGGATLGSPTVATVTILNDDAGGDPVTVTASAGTPMGTYATLTAAIAAVNDGTHQGNIVISINQNTTEPGTIVLNSSGAGAASYTSLIVRPTADALTVAGASVQGRGLIELNGADNVTIDGDNPNTAGTNRNLTIQNTAANTVTFTSVIRIALATTLVNTADNNTFKNLIVLGSATGRNTGTATTTTGTENTTFGIFLGPGASTTVATNPPAAVASVSTGVGTGATATNLMVSNNNVRTAARAISINGSATTVAPGLQIANNSIGNPVAGEVDQVTAIGITAQGSTNAVISGNTVWVEGYVASSAAGHGINVGVNSTTAINGATIENNKVNRVKNNNPTTFSAFGVNLGGGNDHIVRNNFISGVINDQTAGTGGFGTTFGAYGIRIVLGTGHDIYHNSVHLYGVLPGATSTDLTAAFMITSTLRTGLDVRNNIFSNQITGGNPAGTRHVAVFLPSGATATMNLIWNNNAYFVAGDALNRLAQVGTVFGTGEYQAGDFDPTQTTPATNFRAYTSTLSAAGTNDNASFAITGTPPFVSNTDLHIPAGTATRLESGGAAVGVTTDIDAEMRNATTPDIGADEFAGNPAPANDIGAVGFVVPANGSTIPTGGLTPQARFTNAGTATQTNVTVRFRIIDSTMTTIYNQTATIPTISPLQNIVVSFPMTTIASPGAYTMQAAAELAGDQNTSNDIINGAFNAVVPISGTVSVGTGETFTSLTNPGGLFQALNTAGIGGNVIVNITSDLTAETGAVALNQLAEAAPGGFTVTFKPSGAARVISGSSASSAGLINLHGADRIIFDGSTSGGTDRSLTITNNQTTTTTVFWLRSASASNGATNNTIKNCIINGAPGPNSTTTAGILTGSGVTLGNDAESPNSNNTIQNNHIYRVQNSMYLRGGAGANIDLNWVVTGNDMGSAVANDNNIFRGMLIGNSQNFMVTNNTVQNVRSTATTTASMSGIQIALVVNAGTVSGNRITNIKNVSGTGTGANGISFISTSTASNVTVANNFVSDVAANGSATITSNGFGINVAAGGGYRLYHNSVNVNTNQASGTTAALFVNAAVTTAGGLDVRNNIFANTQTAGATRRAVHSAAAAAVFGMIDYNDYFSTGSVGFIGGVDRPTLADWQAGTSQDANSKAVDPLFVSPTDLHLQPASTLLGMGVSGTGITTDIDGQTRDTPPDIGADEIPAGATPGSVQFSSATYSIVEAGGTVTLTVTRTGGSAGAISVNYATAGVTATGGASCAAGIDYVNANGTLNWADGDTTAKTFDVTICNDAVFEADETFTGTLSGATGGATIGMPNPATVTITNDDPPPGGSLSINDVRVFEGNSGAVNATFTVTYSGPSVPVSVDYATANGTAVAGADYLMAAGTLNFSAAGTQTVTVVVIGDVAKEANETYFVNLSNATGASISDGQGVGIIIDEDRPYVADFDHDHVSDFSVFRPSQGLWYVLLSASATPEIVALGISTDVPVPGDYDGDGITDYAVWRPSTGEWFRHLSATATKAITSWGITGDKPVQGDYDGDGKTDLAIFRPSTGAWWILNSSTGLGRTATFGISTDRPVQGDYDGDAKTDIAVYRDGTWYIARSSDSMVQITNWGLAADRPVSGDFDGDGKFDLAIYRNGTWWVLNSLTGPHVVALGVSTDIPVPADYDGDGTTDRAVFRPSNGDWYVLRSSTGTVMGPHWGSDGDKPVPAAYLPQ